MIQPSESAEPIEEVLATENIRIEKEAVVGMGAIMVGSLVSFTGAAVEAANTIYVHGGLINIAPEQKHSGKEFMITGGLMVVAGISSWLHGIRSHDQKG